MGLLFLFALAGLAQGAPDDDGAFDLRCLVAVTTLADSDNEEFRTAAAQAMFFFFGRVDARVGSDALEDAINDTLDEVDDSNLPILLQQCGTFLEERGRALEAVGRRIMDRSIADR